MRIFVAGATGVMGRRLVPALLRAGHEVTGMTRSSAHIPRLESVGARGVVADALDRHGLSQAVIAAQPEVVVHQLTNIPRALDFRRFGAQMAATDRLRREGTSNLVDAALAAGARRVVAQSIAFAYAPRGSWVKSEEDPLDLGADPPWRQTVEAIQSLERSVTKTDGLEGIVLRYGFFYGPGTAYAVDGATAELVRKRRLPIVGEGTGVFSFVHIDDAAEATRHAVARGACGVYNVVDDHPAPQREWLPIYAEALGAKPPRRVPKFVARLVGGRLAARLATELRGASNERAKAELGWKPHYASWRKGFETPPPV